MKIRNDLRFVVCLAVALLGASGSFAAPYRVSRLSPESFDKMYYIASQGRVGVLREAISRGLYIDVVNANDDTGLCVAIKKRNHVAYNSFRMSGANPRHRCTYRIQKQYDEFLNSGKIADKDKIVGNSETLYYTDADRGFWPWILGGLAVGGGAIALSGGGGSSQAPVDDTIVPTRPNEGVVDLISKYNINIKDEDEDDEIRTNKVGRYANNPNADIVRDSIKFLPNMLTNADFLSSYVKVENGGYTNDIDGVLVLGDRRLGTSGDGAVGISATGKNSTGTNKGNIKVEAFNGAIGMASSKGADIYNGEKASNGEEDSDGVIDIIFRGSKEGDTIIGMLADTHSTAINYGTITGTTSDTEDNLSKADDVSSSVSDKLEDLLDQVGSGNGSSSGDGSGETEGSTGTEEGTEEEKEEKILSKNSGTILGMALFDYYTGSNKSQQTVTAINEDKIAVTAINEGKIDLKAGYNGASEIGVSLIGMGSYIDDNFLKGNNNPNYAEQMILNNYGDINLAYQGQYTIAEDALKLGDGGLIGMRADAQSVATNNGSIIVDMQATTLEKNVDVGAGMLSVHGGQLDNNRTITMLNEATSGGVSYGMLAAKGDGSQSNIYKWKKPKITNSKTGIIDMYVSNSYAMASFAGGDVTNNGTINLGLKNGHSYYTNNVGLYAAGEDKTEEVALVNEGTINLYSEQSAAIKSDYSGSVTMKNVGEINVSNKATGAKVFDGNFSTANNEGSITFKVDNSEKYSYPLLNDGSNLVEAIRADTAPIGYVVELSNGKNTKQYFVNNGTLTIGGKLKIGEDYGGTYGVAGVGVFKYAGALNDGNIVVENYSSDRGVFNVGMYLTNTSGTQAYIRNTGIIDVEGTYSVGMRSDSEEKADATNYGDIYVNGIGSVGMHADNERAVIYNGRVGDGKVSNKLSLSIIESGSDSIEGDKKQESDSIEGDKEQESDSTEGDKEQESDSTEDNEESTVAKIIVNGKNSVGMSVKSGEVYNYGDIYLGGEGSTAFQVYGETAVVHNMGNVIYREDIKDLAIYWFLGTKTDYELKYADQEPKEVDIKNITLAKISDGTSFTFTKDSNVELNIKGENGRFAKIVGEGEVFNEGTLNVSEGAIGIETDVRGESVLASNTYYGKIDVTGRGIGIKGEGENVEINNIGNIAVGVIKDTDENTVVEGDESEATGENTVVEGDESEATDENTVVEGDESKAIGIHASAYSTVTHSGKINVKNGGIGIKAIDGNIEAQTTVSVLENANMDVSDDGSIGYKISGGALLEDAGTVNVSNCGVGTQVESGGTVNATSKVTVGENSIGYYVTGGKVTYEGNAEDDKILAVNGAGAIGMSNNGGSVLNEGTISVGGDAIGIKGESGTSINSDAGIISVGSDGTGMMGNGIINNGKIDVVGGVGMSGSGSNQADINVSGGIGVNVTNGNFTNTGRIDGSGTGVKVTDGGSFTNSGEISIDSGNGVEVSGKGSVAINSKSGVITVASGTGMYAESGGSAENYGRITVASGTGMYAGNGGTAKNYGTITVTSSGKGMYAGKDGNIVNDGTIEYHSKLGGQCGVDGVNCTDLDAEDEKNSSGSSGGVVVTPGEGGSVIITPTSVKASDIINVSNGGSFVNNGQVSLLGLDVDFDEMRDETSKYVVTEKGKYEADTLKGEVWVGKDVVMNGFDDTYQKEDAFVGKNEGLVVGSQSYMFEAIANTTEDVTDVELNRKKFEDLIEDENVAEFLEVNYNLHNNEKMFGALKSAETKGEFEATTKSETGENFYANLPRENMAVLRGLNVNEQNRILNDGLNGVSVGGDYYRTGKDGNGVLSGYDADIYSAYIGYGEKINKNWNIGATLRASYVDSSYDEANSTRDNKIFMAFMPILYKNNNMKFLTMPSLGFGMSEYERGAVSGNYEADTFDLYYGLYNHAEYSIDVKVAELVTEAELNLQGVSMGSAKEDDGLKLKSNHSTSLEAGIGVKLRKQIQLAKERSLMLALGTKYYHEFLDPYRKLTVGMNGSPVDLRHDGYDEGKNRLRTSAEAIYKDGDFAISAEIAHNAEEKSNIEGGLGVRYNF